MSDSNYLSIVIQKETFEETLDAEQALTDILDGQVFLESVHRLLDSVGAGKNPELDELVTEVSTLLSGFDVAEAKTSLKNAIAVLHELNAEIRLNCNMNLVA